MLTQLVECDILLAAHDCVNRAIKGVCFLGVSSSCGFIRHSVVF